MKIQIEHQIPDQYIDDIIAAALEGGINYWCAFAKVADDNYFGKEFASDVLTAGGALILGTEEDDGTFVLDLDKIKAALEQLCSEGPWREMFTEFITTGDHDAETADILVQYALFGELVYA